MLRRTPLIRRTPLARTGAPRRRTALRWRSEKREAIAPERAAFVARILRERPWCEACPTVRVAVPGLYRPEQVRNAATGAALAVDVHEIVRRSQGTPTVPSQGLTDDDVLAVCRTDHRWITDHPREAVAFGLARWARRPV